MKRLKCKDLHIYKIHTTFDYNYAEKYHKFFWDFFKKVTGKSYKDYTLEFGLEITLASELELLHDFNIYQEYSSPTRMFYLPKDNSSINVHLLECLDKHNIKYKKLQKRHLPMHVSCHQDYRSELKEQQKEFLKIVNNKINNNGK